MTQDEAREYPVERLRLRYRPEMRRMERSLLLNQLDTSWKNHLYTMDHLRSGIGLWATPRSTPRPSTSARA